MFRPLLGSDETGHWTPAHRGPQSPNLRTRVWQYGVLPELA